VIKTENLTILFVDIAGFTATTSRQSRAQNARLLQTFGSTLFPLIKHYKGRLIKTIGDALMLTFRSPTDAMLCAMALQDAMHAHNLSAQDDEKIHIRVAANLGEVRVTKNDIFGEPVNVASRIEGVAPADEIYLSEAVYMAMNKAEVPSAEVGFTELKGISQAVRLYNIPRFSTPRLVAENASADEKGNEILYPYGGMHCQAHPGKVSEFFHRHDHKKLTDLLIPTAAVLVGIAAVVIGYNSYFKTTSPSPEQAAKSVIQEAKKDTGTLQPSSMEPAGIKADGEKAGQEKAINEPVKTEKGQEYAAPAPQTTKKMPVAEETSKAISPKATETASIKTPPVIIKKAPSPDDVRQYKPAAEPAPEEESEEEPVDEASTSEPIVNKTPEKAISKTSSDWNVIKAKAAYRATKISKAEYAKIINKLKTDYNKKIVQLKTDYRAGKITRAEYEKQVRKAKQDYNGR
jgi:adenylate cyclase